MYLCCIISAIGLEKGRCYNGLNESGKVVGWRRRGIPSRGQLSYVLWPMYTNCYRRSQRIVRTMYSFCSGKWSTIRWNVWHVFGGDDRNLTPDPIPVKNSKKPKKIHLLHTLRPMTLVSSPMYVCIYVCMCDVFLWHPDCGFGLSAKSIFLHFVFGVKNICLTIAVYHSCFLFYPVLHCLPQFS